MNRVLSTLGAMAVGAAFAFGAIALIAAAVIGVGALFAALFANKKNTGSKPTDDGYRLAPPPKGMSEREAAFRGIERRLIQVYPPKPPKPPKPVKVDSRKGRNEDAFRQAPEKGSIRPR